MFQPLPGIDYLLCNPDSQILVCTLSSPRDAALAKWGAKAAALFELHKECEVGQLLLDLIANPFIRMLCFDGEGNLRPFVDAVWADTKPANCPLTDEHLTLIRQYVALFDGDCFIRVPMFPYWPEPIRYNEEGKSEQAEDHRGDGAREGR